MRLSAAARSPEYLVGPFCHSTDPPYVLRATPDKAPPSPFRESAALAATKRSSTPCFSLTYLQSDGALSILWPPGRMGFRIGYVLSRDQLPCNHRDVRMNTSDSPFSHRHRSVDPTVLDHGHTAPRDQPRQFLRLPASEHDPGLSGQDFDRHEHFLTNLLDATPPSTPWPTLSEIADGMARSTRLSAWHHVNISIRWENATWQRLLRHY